MNERIKELAEQVGGEFYEGFAGSTNFVKFTEDDFEKFAELLVKECADVATLNQYKAFTPGHYVKKHFGVES